MPQGFNNSGNSSYSRKKRIKELPGPKPIAKKEEPGLASRMFNGFMERVNQDSMVRANIKADQESKKRRK